MSTIIFQFQSTLILALIYLGVAQRKNRTKHVKIMKGAILWDLALILQIELTRSAIAKAVKTHENSFILNFHVSIAVLTVLLYGLLFITGRQMLNNHYQNRPKHKFIGILTIILRTSTYLTSYLI